MHFLPTIRQRPVDREKKRRTASEDLRRRSKRIPHVPQPHMPHVPHPHMPHIPHPHMPHMPHPHMPHLPHPHLPHPHMPHNMPHMPHLHRAFEHLGHFPSNLESGGQHDGQLQSQIADTSDRTAFRKLPIFSGILIPFSIMLSIPSLTGHWYVRTDEDHALIEVRKNPLLLDIAMAFSMACGALANICLVIRFSERRIKLMTILCIAFLSLHDIINIPSVTIFGVIHRFDDGFTYGQPFWLTVCSTIFSTATNITLIYDYLRTKDFEHSGSGLTHKQRALVIILIILLCYVSLGSALLAVTLDISFLDGLYFSIVSIETIGYGDLHPISTGTRILVCLYISGGILNLALLVALSREALLEAAAESVQARLRASRTHARERNIRTRWRAAVRWRLKSRGLPTWIDDCRKERPSRTRRISRVRRVSCRYLYSWPRRIWRYLTGEPWHEWDDPAWKYVRGPGYKLLNLEALSETQLEAAALEAGLALSELIPKDFLHQNHLSEDEDYQEQDDDKPSSLSWRHPFLAASAAEVGKQDVRRHPPSLTHVRVGGMVSLLASFALAVTHGTNVNGEPRSSEEADEEVPSGHNPAYRGVPFTRTATTMTLLDDDEGIYVVDSLETVERNAFYTRLCLSLTLFFVFWMAGAAIFMKTEGWAFGSSLYFCFISFSTVGYGDLAPKTQAGRSIFIVWALLGVGTMTILISILADAYSNSYKNIIKTETMSSPFTFSVEHKQPSHQPNLADLDVSAVSAPKPIPEGILNSPGNLTLRGGLTPLLPSPVINENQASSRPRRATLTIAVPDNTHANAGGHAKLSALPMDVLRRVDHLMSVMATRSHLSSQSAGDTTTNRPGVSHDVRDVELESAQTEALIKEIKENLVEIANASKEALQCIRTAQL